MLRFLASLALFVASITTGLQAQDAVTILPSTSGGMVTQIVDGDTLFLSNGVEVRMVGIQAPKLPLGRANFRKWPLADEAAATLKALSAGRHFDRYFGGARMDRHGRSLAHLVDKGGLWLQGEMLRLGLARVYTFPDNTALADHMLALEAQARTARFGIWSHPFYAIRHHDRIAPADINTFQLVEGQVHAVARVRGTTYVNFAEDWRRDFTIVIRKKAARRFPDGAVPDWRGKKLRVRGWLKSRNGPMIEATHPEQIEVLD